MQLRDYVLVADNAIGDDVCEFAMEVFEHNTSIRESCYNPGRMHFQQLNITSFCDGDMQLTALQQYLNKATRHYIDLYKSRVKDTQYWPNNYGFEEYRLKRYEANGVDQFADHIDAANLSSSRRFLVFFWYLNNVQEGGETEFLNMDLRVKPRKGRLLMFPPLWNFPHRGCKPISGPKYILGSYLHFV